MIAKIKKQDLCYLFSELKKTHKVIGPKIESNVQMLSSIDFSDIPAGYVDYHSAGMYRLVKSDKTDFFTFSNGPESFKRYLTPPQIEIYSYKASRKRFATVSLTDREQPFAFFGMRACDRAALKLYDRVFLEGVFRDHSYDLLRGNLLIIAVNCIYPSYNCFCLSAGTGPELRDGYDLLITELEDAFLLESGSQQGARIMNVLPLIEADNSDIIEKASRIRHCKEMFKKSINLDELPGLIYQNLEHPIWLNIAERDLECGNCTQVCPTCFCSSSYDFIELKGISRKLSGVSGKKVRKWDSCFSRNFARVHGGNFRSSRKARYRHWFAHKLAYCMEQFGLHGCVGCGRCITWCPAGIDITHELEALRVAKQVGTV